jgi:hypothetical protein
VLAPQLQRERLRLPLLLGLQCTPLSRFFLLFARG